ncbi:LOW QUALITY PROTEIN: acid sphingomyelinase-like phosphodiesterase 3b [Haliotis rubra]|uniref:LOW QUALITY PROTEIN: acid sphingomyelinase-like phosphodiesterase 3b n=1 Tax=Haliotis rubra TaxID=36100 RepID=UPI001EE5C800|nr:LOW QUALITY PROTEIN: acid sphingomyelinase-like phosphodiesterase 3b [Haliotis rubra]
MSRYLLLCLTLGVALDMATPEEGQFWHITDHHFDPTYWSEMRSCNDKVPVRGIYGDYWCDSPWRLVNDSVAAMANVKRDVDFIVWTGDNVAHIQNQFLNQSLNLKIIEKITDALKSEFPGVPVYGTMGNHDWYPADQFPVQQAFLYNATAELWRDWIGDKEQIENFKKGGFYTIKTTKGLRIVGLNTVLYYTADKLTPKLTDPAGQFAWLEEVFQNATNAGEKVMLTAHVPPGIKVPGKVLWFYEQFNTRLLDLVQKYSDVIPAMYFGHDHADGLKLVLKKDGTPGVPMFIAPSVTPWRYKSRTESGAPHNPAIRLVKYNQQTGEALDYIQYYMNLTESNEVNASTWKVAYDASTTYRVSDLAAASVSRVVQQMSTDRNLLNNYIRFNTVLANGNSTVDECDATL